MLGFSPLSTDAISSAPESGAPSGGSTYTLTAASGSFALTGSDANLVYTPVSGEQPAGSPHGFEIVDSVSPLWWKRRKTDDTDEEAERKVAKVAKQIRRIVVKQIEDPAPSVVKTEYVKQAIAPLLRAMPGFDWQPLYHALIAQELQKALQRKEAQRIEQKRIDEDEEDALILMMA